MKINKTLILEMMGPSATPIAPVNAQPISNKNKENKITISYRYPPSFIHKRKKKNENLENNILN